MILYECHVCDIVYCYQNKKRVCPVCGVEGLECTTHTLTRLPQPTDRVCRNCCKWYSNNKNTGFFCTTYGDCTCSGFKLVKNKGE